MPSKPEPHGGIIVIGMHRSGTSMVAGLVRGLGVYLGADCGVLEESAFFRGLNIRILRAAGASWYRPGPLLSALRDTQRCEVLAAKLRRDLWSPARCSFLEEEYRAHQIGEWPGAWGWKDPRTTLTLPLWRLVFPRARVVHVIRNGVDVAHSLMERDRSSPQPRFKALRYLLHRVWPRQWPEFRWRPFRDLQEAFELWAEYVRFGVEATAPLAPDDVFQILYEDFVADPATGLKSLSEFLKITVYSASLERLSSTVSKDRCFAFLTNGSLTEFYARCHDHPMMRRFGYDNLSQTHTRILDHTPKSPFQ